jgi:hypothetical protein
MVEISQVVCSQCAHGESAKRRKEMSQYRKHFVFIEIYVGYLLCVRMHVW